MSAHTPGPWFVDEHLALIITGPTVTGPDFICDYYSIANAYLISAAPDMYEALRQALKLFGNVTAQELPSTFSISLLMEQAIAKAEGRA